MTEIDDNDTTVIVWVSVIMGLILLITILYIFVIRPGHYKFIMSKFQIYAPKS